MPNRLFSLLMLSLCTAFCFQGVSLAAEGKPAAGGKIETPKNGEAQQLSPKEAKSLAQEHYTAGLARIEAEDYAGAADAFKASVNLFPTKEGYLNLANCYKAVDDYASALSTIEEMKLTFEKELTKKWKRDIEEFESSIRELIAYLSITVNRDGASVLLDGELIGKSPVKSPLMVDIGNHEITVSMTGYQTESRRVKLRSGEQGTVSVELRVAPSSITVVSDINGAAVYVDGKLTGSAPLVDHPLAPGSHTVSVTHPGYPSAEEKVDLHPGETATLNLYLKGQEPLPAADAPTPGKRRIWMPIAFGVGGAAAVGGLVTGLMNNAKAKDLEKVCDDNVCPDSAKPEWESAKRLGVATNVLLATAAVGVTLGTILIFVEGRERKPAAAATPPPPDPAPAQPAPTAEETPTEPKQPEQKTPETSTSTESEAAPAPTGPPVGASEGSEKKPATPEKPAPKPAKPAPAPAPAPSPASQPPAAPKKPAPGKEVGFMPLLGPSVAGLSIYGSF